MLRHSMELRIINNLMRAVQAFLELAAMEAADGNGEPAARFAAEAEHSIGVVAALLAAVPDEFSDDKSHLALQAEALEQAVRDMRSKISSQ